MNDISIMGEVHMVDDDKQDPKPEDVIEDAYPKGLAEGEPISLDGNEIGRVVILPKGFEAEDAALASLRAENINLSKQVATITSERDDLKSKLDESEKAATELRDTMDGIETKKREEAVEGIAALRIEKGFLKEEDKDDFVKKLSELSPNQLVTQLEDTQALSAIADNPDPEVPAEDDKESKLSEEEQKKAELSKKLFGDRSVYNETDGDE